MEPLELIKEQIKSYVQEIGDAKSSELLELLPSGKMLRSKLILKIAGVSEETLRLCAIVEMIHAASLLHDDVIDDATTRRGKETINALFDNKTSIMFGDILYSKAFSELTKMPTDVAYAISSAVTKLSVGELLDVELSKNFNSSYDTYLDMIYKKTASLIEACSLSGAILAGKNIENFATYGKNLGLAFQMVDDILDITEDAQKLGKPAMLDFVEGKVTIPYLLLFERIDFSEKEKLKRLFKKELSSDELLWIKTKMETTFAIHDSIEMAKKFGFLAIDAIKDEKNDDLILIMKAMIERDF
jgi:octaprenyl-diphosphate synthase